MLLQFTEWPPVALATRPSELYILDHLTEKVICSVILPHAESLPLYLGCYASFHTRFRNPGSDAHPTDPSVNHHINTHAFLQHHKLLVRSQPEHLRWEKSQRKQMKAAAEQVSWRPEISLRLKQSSREPF